MVRSATQVQYDAEDDEPRDCDNFDRSEYELCFTVGSCREMSWLERRSQ